VDKPAGPTSHDIVDRVRRALGVRRVGHTGTLDPFATGVLPVCVGKATRLARFLADGDKVYKAEVRLGFATTTDDRTGQPLGAPSPVSVSRAELEAACRSLVGELQQVPPSYSAKHVDGRRLYELAREGTVVEARPVSVTVHALEVRTVEADRVSLEVRCSPGTYIRSLARDLGAALGCGGHLTALRRTRSSGFGLEGAVAGDALGPESRDRLVPLRRCLEDLPAARVTEEGRRALVHGRDLPSALVASGFPPATGEPAPERFRILDEEGELLALAVPIGFGPEASGLHTAPVLHPDVVLLG
jgi:tRNA pseudouridine55 synthase